MKKNTVLTALIISFFISSAGCRKDRGMNEKQLILFQYDYYNNAWGLRHSGFIIDNKGDIMTYENPEKWNSGDELTEEQVIENMHNCKLSEIKIPEEELHKFRNYIPNIASSKITAKKNVAYDAGTARFICYQYLDGKTAYKGHLIKMEGDYTCENLNLYSKKVTSWMRSIGNEISRDSVNGLTK